MRRHLYIILILALASTNLWAQRQVDYADKLFAQLRFSEAAGHYRESLGARQGVNDPAHVLSRIGDCYRLMNQSEEAVDWYARAAGTGQASPETMYHYAQSLRAVQKYDDALRVFREYGRSMPGDKDIRALVESLTRMEYLARPQTGYAVGPVDFNTDASDFAPCINGDKIIFATNGRPVPGGKVDPWTGEAFLQLYEASFSGQEVRPYANGVNGRYHDGPLAIDPVTGDRYVTRSNYSGRKVSPGRDQVVKLKLIRLDADGNLIDDFPFNGVNHSVGHAAFSSDGNTLVFASDMEHADALGGTDLYLATRSNGTWGGLRNLGPEINSTSDELFPFIAEDGRLYYASNGKGGLGGLDICEALPESGSWSQPYVLGAPLNTHKDDFGLVFLPGSRRGFFASNRAGGRGGDDIYQFSDHGHTLAGRLVDAATGEPLSHGKVMLIQPGLPVAEALTGNDGVFRFSARPGTAYEISVCLDGYHCRSSGALIPEESNGSTLTRLEFGLVNTVAANLLVRIVDAATGYPITGARAGLEEACTGNAPEGSPRGEGWHFQVASPCELSVIAQAEGYAPANAAVYLEAGADTVLTVELVPAESFDAGALADGLVFHHIYYDYDRSDIRTDAEDELTLIAEFLSDNPTARVRIEAHTDARATSAYNLNLSRLRAESARQWLVARGVGAERIETEGYGESRPVNGCSDNVACSEQEHQRNRRTEFRIMSGIIESNSLERFSTAGRPCETCPF